MIQTTFQKSIHRSCCIRVMMYPITFYCFCLFNRSHIIQTKFKKFLQQLSITLRSAVSKKSHYFTKEIFSSILHKTSIYLYVQGRRICRLDLFPKGIANLECMPVSMPCGIS